MATTKQEAQGDGANAEQTHPGLTIAGVRQRGTIHWNLPIPQLIEEALRRDEAVLAANGALAAETGKFTGRSPGDKFIVDRPSYHDRIWWGSVNQPLAVEKFTSLHEQIAHYFQDRDLFVLDATVGADSEYGITVRVIGEFAWHCHFSGLLFRDSLVGRQSDRVPDFTVLAAPGFRANPQADGTNSETVIALDLEDNLCLIAGTEYAGEIKKSLFTVMNYLLPLRDVFPMHCSASMGEAGDVALFFGLSGTGKTTLSTDPARRLIGDDEHGWSERGIFNFEGGSYAKLIDLSRDKEPLIWDAMRFGAVMENIVLDPDTREPRYEDGSLTENTRGAYPLSFIEGVVDSGTGGHPAAILLLTADAEGVLPPLSILTPEQAEYHFLSGYTSKVAGTERDLGDAPEATFSTCYASPFIPSPPRLYGDMLAERVARHGVRCYLVNTGWTGGPFGIGKRMDLAQTRALVNAAIRGELDDVESEVDPHFGFRVPLHCPGVPDEVLLPRDTWADGAAYDKRARLLAQKFATNFAKYATGVSEAVRRAGPHLD
jgi:phosphoenolpyruvate carboxykinase (ATP)